jgi:hypothetical protein
VEPETKKKTEKKPKKKEPPANFLRELAGGWTRVEAVGFFGVSRTFRADQ